jgi:cytochrome P450
MDPYGFFDRRRARYGDVFDVRVTGQRWTVLCDPAAVQEVFRHGPEDLNSGEANEPLRPLIGRRNVLLLDGDEHLARRKLVLPPFHGDRMRAYEGIVRAACDEAFDALPLGEPVAMLPVVQDVTYEVILRAVFGIDEAARVVALRDALRELLEWTIKLRNAFVFSYLGPDRLIRMRAFQRRRRVVDRLVHEQIAQRRTDPSIASRTDILSLLLQARFEDGSALTDLDVRDELVTLLLAGHDTTSAELTWAIDALAWAPDVGDRIGAGEKGLVDAAWSETLRLRPPLPIVVRSLRRPLTIGGTSLPTGAIVAPCATVVHRRADLWPDPDRWDPGRWLGGSRPAAGTYFPFGGGVRRCVGASFATFEARIVLTELLRRFTMRPALRIREPVWRRGVVLIPMFGGRVVLTPR